MAIRYYAQAMHGSDLVYQVVSEDTETKQISIVEVNLSPEEAGKKVEQMRLSLKYRSYEKGHITRE